MLTEGKKKTNRKNLQENHERPIIPPPAPKPQHISIPIINKGHAIGTFEKQDGRFYLIFPSDTEITIGLLANSLPFDFRIIEHDGYHIFKAEVLLMRMDK